MSLPRLLSFLLGAAFITAVFGALLLAWLWRDRPSVDEIPLPVVESLPDDDSNVTATWLGITTLLIDDGTTQILVDGAFTRLSLFEIGFLRPVSSDIATINYALDEFRINRLAAIVAVHAHFDHAIDVGRVANRSTALVVATESVANIARGADVPVDQSQILASGESRTFGDFTITVLESRHAGRGFPGGVIGEPLAQPASVLAYRGGAARSLLIAHPAGSALIMGSAGYVDGVLEGRSADVAFLSVAGLAEAGPGYTRDYWAATVGATDARDAFIVHFDDFTRPFGEVALFPRVVDDVPKSAAWLRDLAEGDGVRLQRPLFGVPVPLY